MANTIDYAIKDYAGFKADALDRLKTLMPEYTDRSETDAGIVIIELLSHMADVLSFNQDVQANECFLVTAEQMANILRFCGMLDYTPRYASPAGITLKFSFTTPENGGTLTIKAGTRVATTANEPVYFETTKDVTVVLDTTSETTTIGITNSDLVYAIEGYTHTENLKVDYTDVLNFNYCITSYNSVISSSPKVFVDTDITQDYPAAAEWTKVDSFYDSGPEDTHFKVLMLSDTYAAIVFGNGVNGANPFSGDNVSVTCEYRVGVGSNGNLDVNSELVVDTFDTTLVTAEETFEDSITPSSVTANILSFYQKGYDTETKEQIRYNAPNAWRNKKYCVKTQDFADRLIEIYPQVLDASAKNFEDGVLIDHVYVYMMLEDGVTTSDIIQPEVSFSGRYLGNTEPIELIVDMQNMFNDRKIVGTYVDLFDATKISLALNVAYTASSNYISSTIESNIITAITTYFTKGNRKLGESLTITDLEYYVKTEVDGLRMLRISPTDATKTALGIYWNEEKELIRVPKNSYLALSYTGSTPDITCTKE